MKAGLEDEGKDSSSGTDKALAKFVLKKKIKDKTVAAMDSSCEAFNTCLFLLVSDAGRYKPLKLFLEKEHLMGRSNYSKTMVDTKRMMANFTGAGEIRRRCQSLTRTPVEWSLLRQASTTTPG